MNDDNDETRRAVEHCYRTNKVLVNPIIDWTDEDVWEFIHSYNVPYCGLYDEGCKRIGCIGCPMGGAASMKREFQRWPLYKKMYIHAFDDMLEERRKHGKDDTTGLWTSGERVFAWWIGDIKKKGEGQISMEEYMED